MRSWNAYRINRAAQFIGNCAAGLVILSPALPKDTRSAISYWINAHPTASISVFALILLLMVVPTLNLINWRCPQCQELFSYPSREATTCQHCGLAKFADPRLPSS